MMIMPFILHFLEILICLNIWYFLRWYAAILESTGAAIASASVVSNGIDQQDAFMRTALHYAAEQGHLGVVKLLIEAGNFNVFIPL